MEKQKNLTLKMELVKQDMTQKGLAREIGMPRTMLNANINGSIIPNQKEMQRIANGLNKPTAEIF